MATTSQTEALETWLRSNGAYIHPDVKIIQSEECGIHMRATATIPPRTNLASVPHSVAFSYLNAVVDEAYPIFKQNRNRFKVEAIGYFYLMMQYVDREQSFWKPYLDALPSPDDELTQPLFFYSAEDIAWLEGTDVWHTVTGRQKVYTSYFEDGLAVLQEAGIETERYTWHLFLWAVSMYTSRSFSSRSLRPHSGKYWAAYKTSQTPQGRVRQAVILDMSNTSAEDLHFPVLFPGLDAANHNHDSKVDWTFDSGLFSIALAGPHESNGVAAGNEVFNNYGPKSNGELLIGYGFCMSNNPHDSVAMLLKAPTIDLQKSLHTVHPGYFTPEGVWRPEKATFDLKSPPHVPQTSSGLIYRPQIFHELPEPLLELLTYLLQHERGLAFAFIEHPLDYLTDLEQNGCRYLPHIARMIASSLAPKLQVLQSTTPATEPRYRKQQYASLYRSSQLAIMTTLLSALSAYTRALIYIPRRMSRSAPIPSGNKLMYLPTFIHMLETHGLVPEEFLAGIAANAGTDDLDQLRQAGWEEDIWVLLLSWLSLNLAELPAWLREAGAPAEEAGRREVDDEAVAQAADLMTLVETAALACPESRWAEVGWSANFVAATGGRKLREDSFLVKSLDPDPPLTDADEKQEEEVEEVRLFVHFLFP